MLGTAGSYAVRDGAVLEQRLRTGFETRADCRRRAGELVRVRPDSSVQAASGIALELGQTNGLIAPSGKTAV